ncbi:MAG: hypothetical protein HYX96_05490 [Chloroflexi bacterium]|nr:hypothetical protein [Chloroflexota bacterium]
MNLSEKVLSDEPLGRFLTEHNHFGGGGVKFKAFMPPPKTLALSVFRIHNLTLDQIWEIGENKVIKVMEQEKTLYGVADIKAEIVTREGLAIKPDPLPSRHTNIINWPQEKYRQLSIAQVLATEAELKLKPRSR